MASNSLSVDGKVIISPATEPSAKREDEQAYEYPSGSKMWLILFALCLVGFIISLDSTVVATAIPVISDEFHSLADIGWYSSVYFLTMCLPQLPLMKVYSRYSIRWTYSAAMALFLAGSALCGGAPNSPALVAGRALAGLGAGGLYTGNNALVPVLAPPSKRPVFFGVFLGAMGLGLGCGPLIGGVFTQNVTWRWNFYLNLPIGAIVYVIFFLFVLPPAPVASTETPISWSDFVQTLDLPGLVILTPSVLCLLLALQWGGVAYQWNDVRIVVLLVLFGVLAIVFLINEVWQGNNAMLQGRIMKQRNVICAVWFGFCCNGSTSVLNYYLPVWFQGVQGVTPLQSGVHTLPLVVMTAVTSILGGGLMTLWGHIGLFMVLGSASSAIGAGLLTSLNPNTSTGKWIGYQLLCAVGCAAGKLCPSVSLQNILDPQDVTYGYTLLTAVAAMGGAIFVSVSQALFANFFTNGLQSLGLPESEISAALKRGVNTITDGLSGEAKTAVLDVVNKSLVHVWLLSVVLFCLGVVGAVIIEHHKIEGANLRREQNQDTLEETS